MNDFEILMISYHLQRLFGGKVTTRYDVNRRLNVWEIDNDDIGHMEITATDGCLFWESLSTRLKRMCEEYDAHMRYKYRDMKGKVVEDV